MSAHGISQTAMSVPRIRGLPSAVRSLRTSRVASGNGKCGIFSCIAGAEMTVSSSAIRMHASLAARPAVKLRLTGFLPESITARFAM